MRKNLKKNAVWMSLIVIMLLIVSGFTSMQMAKAQPGNVPINSNNIITPVVAPTAIADFKFPTDSVITDVQMVNGEKVTVQGVEVTLPEYLKVKGQINRRTGVGPEGPAEYYIGFELRLPTQWNGRFFFEGGGGSDGVIRPPLGARYSGTVPALVRGFATVSTDAGHQGADDCSFGYDQQARIDYGYNAIDQVAITAKSIIKNYYGQAERFSYFVGSSNGGRQGLMFAQRFPNYFDGIVAVAPAFNLTNAAIAEQWANQLFAKIAKTDEKGRPLLYTAFSEADMKVVADTILKQFDAADGLEDGLVFDIDAARNFDPLSLPLKTSSQDGLTDEQIETLKLLFQGPKNSKGVQLYSSWPWDPGVGDNAWRGWTLGTEKSAPRNVTLGIESTARLFTTPIPSDYDPKNKMDWGMKFNFDTDPPKVKLSESYIDSESTNLDPFKKLGGKLIMVHGMADPVFSAYDTANYYEKIIERNGGLDATQDFAKLFLIPGMTHSGGGPSTDNFDLFTAIQEWVEEGKSPDKIIARGSKGKPFENVSRPIFAYPLQTVYDGKGDRNSADSFIAETEPISVVINGQLQKFATPPIIINGRTLVPLRGVFEALGAELSWNAAAKTINITKGTAKIAVKIGASNAIANGKNIILDQPAQIIDGLTLVPLRFISESLGAEIDWEGVRKITITQSK